MGKHERDRKAAAAAASSASVTRPTAATTRPAIGESTTLKQQGCGLNNCCRHADECPTDRKVQILAYQKWEEAGRPEGNEMGFWIEAERELTHSNVQVEQLED